MSYKRASIVGGVIAAAVLAWMFAGFLSADVRLAKFDLAQLLPGMRQHAVEAYGSGEVPLWQPRVDCGTPYLADPLNQTLYPGLAIFAAAEVHQGLKLFALLHLLLAALALSLLARDAGATPAGAWIGGVLLMVAGPVLGQFHNHIWMAGLPWFLIGVLGVRRLVARRGGGFPAALLVAVSIGLLVLAGGYELLVPLGYFAAADLVLSAAFAANAAGIAATVRRLVATASLLGLSALGGALLAAAQLLPSLEFADISTRAGGLAAVEANLWALEPLRLPQLLSANWSVHVTRAWHAQEPFVMSTYFGLPAMALAIAGLRRLQRHDRVLWGGFALVMLLLALGGATPLHGLARAVLPGADLFRYPSKLLALLAVPVALGVSLGTSALLNRSERSRKVALYAVVGLAVALVATAEFLIVYRDAVQAFVASNLDAKDEIAPDAIALIAWKRTTRGLFAEVGVALIMGLALMRPRPRVLARGLLLVSVVLPVAWTAWNSSRVLYGVGDRVVTEPDSGQRRAYEAPPETLLSLGDKAFQTRLASRQPVPTPRIVPQLLAAWGYRTADRYGALKPAYRVTFDSAFLLGETPSGEARWKDTPRLRLSSVGFALTGEAIEGWESAPVEVEPVAPPPLPRAYLVARARNINFGHADKDELHAALTLRSEDFDPDTEVVLTLTDCAAGLHAVGDADAERGEASILVDEDHRVEIVTRAPGPRLLVLTDTWYPGWSATVDGEPAPIYRANVCFRALPVPPGEHRVVFAYECRPFEVGVVVSGVSVVLLMGLALGYRWRRRRGQRRGA